MPDAYLTTLRDKIRDLAGRVDSVRSECTYQAMRDMQQLQETIIKLERKLSDTQHKLSNKENEVKEMKIDATKRESRILSELEKLHNQVRQHSF